MRRVLLLSLTAAFVLSACGADPKASAVSAAAAPPPLPVESAKIEARAWAGSFETVGSLRADEAIVLRPEVAGKIEKISFVEGGEVSAGQVLFALDASSAQAAENEARVNLETSRVAMTRAQELIGKKLISSAEFDLSQAQFSVSEARLASARTNLAKMSLRAPFAGHVGLRQVSVGDFVNAGQDLVNVVQLNPLEIDFNAPETLLGQVRLGQTVTVNVDAFPGQAFTGAISAIDPVIDVASRSTRIRAQISNADLRLRPGQFARLSVALAAAGNEALLMPEQALMQEGEQRFVYAVVAGKAKKTPIKTGRRRPGLVEITEGLKAGDEVITAGQTKPMMFDGAAVAPIAPEADNDSKGG